MKKWKKWLKRILVLFVLVIAIGAAGAYTLIRRSAPLIDGTLAIEGIAQPVRIIRDIHGIPHIFAENRADLAFGLGYVQAQDRLWQLDMGRHVGQGRLAEVFGPIPEALETDLFFRTIVPNRETLSRQVLAALPSAVRRDLDAFIQGINTFVSTHHDRLPVEFWLTGHACEPFTLEELNGIPLSWMLSLNYYDEVLATKIAAKLGPGVLGELFPEAPQTILPPEAGKVGSPFPIVRSPAAGSRQFWNSSAFAHLSPSSLTHLSQRLASSRLLPSGLVSGMAAASNSWVVSGERTTTGKPILANDPHLGIQMPSVWYEAHLVAPGLDVVGATSLGFPYILLGHNRRIAWGITNVMADNQDLVIEKVNPDNPRQVWFIDHWEDIQAIRTTIPVKGQTAVEKEILLTRHGPIISPVSPGLEETLALQWAIARGMPEELAKNLESFRLLNMASNWQEFRAAVSHQLGSSNLMYADVDGNIGWQVTGKIPTRAKGNGRFPVPGWTGEYEWTGHIPFEELPSYYLPTGGTQPEVRGSPVSASPTHVIATANQRTVHADYAYPISYAWAPPYRFLRISELLGHSEKMSVEDMQRYQADQYTLLADIVVPALEELAEIATDTDDLHWAVRTLQDWDRRVTPEGPAPVLYELSLLHLMKNTYSDELGELYNDYAGRSGVLYSGLDAILHDPQAKWWDDSNTSAVETRTDILRRSLLGALEEARQRLGTDPSQWQWGQLHRAVFAHPMGRVWPLDWLLNRSVPYGGDTHTVNVAFYRWDKPFDAIVAASYRMVVDLSDITHSFAMNTTGQSGQPFTPHYDDMIQPWADVQYHPMWMEEKDILANAEGTLVLEPQTASGSAE